MGKFFALCILLSASFAFTETEFPIPYVRLGLYSTNRNLNISGMASGSALNTWVTNGVKNEDWEIVYVDKDIYQIKNASTGRFITADGDTARLSDAENGSTQNWNISVVEKDFLGEGLYYKISNVSTGKVLTFNSAGNTITLSDYNESWQQKWRLDRNGLEGFAAYTYTNEGIKAGAIGGLLGKTVFVSNNADLRKYLESSDPLTIVVEANLDFSSEKSVRVQSNKTLIGSYLANEISDIQFLTNEYGYRASDNNAVFGAPSDNMIFTNLTLTAKKNSDAIILGVYSSKNLWVDHCSFISTLTNSVNEVGKFIWINTPYNASDLNRSPDFITISYNIFKNRYWTLVYGTQNGVTTEDRTSVMFNIFDGCVRRLPEIGNGSAHIYSNYYLRSNTSIENDPIAGIIIDAGASGYIENNRFEGFRQESSGYWDFVIMCGGRNATIIENYTNQSQSGSSSVAPYLWASSDSYTTPSDNSWFTPSDIYGYTLINAYDASKSVDAKTFNSKYSGAKNVPENFVYITDYEMSDYVSKRYAHPKLSGVEITTVEIHEESSSSSIPTEDASENSSSSSISEESSLNIPTHAEVTSPKISVFGKSISVQFENFTSHDIQIFDMLGHQIFKANASSITTTVPAAGKYIVRSGTTSKIFYTK